MAPNVRRWTVANRRFGGLTAFVAVLLFGVGLAMAGPNDSGTQSGVAGGVPYSATDADGDGLPESMTVGVPPIAIGNIAPGSQFDIQTPQGTIRICVGTPGDDNINESTSPYPVVGFGGPGNDTITGSATQENHLYGGTGNDTLTGGSASDHLFGGSGNDTLNGADGADILSGDDGDDQLNGGGGNDILQGGDGGDTLNGGSGNDTLDGGNGDDTVNGESGDDYISCYGSGNDTYNGGTGSDTFSGTDGSGGDSYDYGGQDGSPDTGDADSDPDGPGGPAPGDSVGGTSGGDTTNWR
jgi:hypothetical protein